MNSECSIWRVLIFGVNFAPGYPRRYVAKALMESITNQTIRHSIVHMANCDLNQGSEEAAIAELVRSEMAMRRIVDWVPEAFGIFFIAQQFPKIILPTTFSAQKQDGNWQEYPFKCEPVFVTSLDIAKEIYTKGPSQVFESITLRSSMVGTVNKSLESDVCLDNAVLSGPALLGIPADTYTLPKRSIWKKLFLGPN